MQFIIFYSLFNIYRIILCLELDIVIQFILFYKELSTFLHHLHFFSKRMSFIYLRFFTNRFVIGKTAILHGLGYTGCAAFAAYYYKFGASEEDKRKVLEEKFSKEVRAAQSGKKEMQVCAIKFHQPSEFSLGA